MSTPPLFDKPAPQPMTLSQRLAADAYRLRAGEAAKWTTARLKTYRPCEECGHLQVETRGTFGPRRQVHHRRRLAGGLVIELCNEHARLWRERDDDDSGRLT